jgi:NAD(P)H-dependent FMN reductase
MDSFNKRLIRIAAAGARAAGADVTLIDLRDYPLPLYDGDLEAKDGLPANARKLKDLFLANDGLLISAPEYNSSITAVLKNTIDWVSRPVSGEAPLNCFDGKVAGLMSTSPGALGGLRGLVHVRAILQNIRVLTIPEQVAVPNAGEAFAADGTLKDAKQQAAAEALGAKLTQLLARLRA